MCEVLVGGIVVYLWQTWIDLMLTIGIPQPSFASLAQFVLKQDRIPGVAFVDRVYDVAKEGHKPDDEINGEIHLHLGPDTSR